jgi:heterodisulfide reductase subunit C
MARVDPDLIGRVRKLGAFDVTACYSCGNCTATCPLSEGRQSFPRKMIRYALLGLEDKIAASPELWLCHYCGECSDTCPREADPGALMAALRRYAIGRTSLGRIAGLLYHRTAAWVLWALLTALAVGGVLLVLNPHPDLMNAVPLSFISLGTLHDFGIGSGIFLGLVLLVQMIQMARSLGVVRGEKVGPAFWLRGFFTTLVRDVVLQERSRECEKNGRYLAHLAVFWGFLGLLLATVLVFGVDFFGFPDFFRVVAKLLGLLFGAVLMYGSLYFLIKRLGAKDSYSKYSHESDWIFLGLLFLAGLTGFALDLFRWLNLPWPTYIAFAVHLVVVFDLLVTLPFTKFAHAFYRPFALWVADARRRAGSTS